MKPILYAVLITVVSLSVFTGLVVGVFIGIAIGEKTTQQAICSIK